jgi:hypothetical protein
LIVNPVLEKLLDKTFCEDFSLARLCLDMRLEEGRRC